MKGFKKSLPTGLALVLMLVLTPVTAVFAAEDTSAGTFSNNNPPSITYVKLYNTSGPVEVTSMDPQTEYDARVKVVDADGKTDLTTIVVKMYYDNATEGTTKIEYDGKTANTQTCAIITWTQAGIPDEPTDFVLTTMAGTTWVKGTCIEPADLSGEFQFKFTVGKVATEAAGGDADDWQIAAEVTDDSAQTHWAADADGSTMTWYGAINVPDSNTVAWGTVNPGMTWAEGGSSEEALGVAVTYISNGAYDEKVKSSPTWTGVPTGTATLSAAAAGSNEFALKADDTDTLASAVVVDATGVIIDDTGALTEEVGVDGGTNTLWLQLNATFTKALYTGTITYIIADGS